jgi:hypothetical protein
VGADPARAPAPGRAGAELAAAAAVAAGYLGLVWAWAPAYLALTYDDSFYYLQIARNVARGLGPTFDGVEPTNGFHPLWLAPFAALARALPGAGPGALMRAALTAQVGLVALGTWALARARWARPRDVALATALAFAHSDAAKVAVNGLESALLYAALAAAASWGSGAAALAGGRRAAGAGAAWAAALLARSDALLAFAAWAAAALGWPGGPARARARARPLAVACAVALAPPALYALWSAAHFGHATAVSGAIKYEGLWHPPYAARWGPPALAALALALAGRALARRAAADPGRDGAYGALFVLVAYAGGQWALTYGARGLLAPDPWYWVPLLLAIVIAIAVALGRPGGRGRAARWLVALDLALAAAGWWRRLDPGAYALGEAYARAGAWLRAAPWAGERAAGWDCGVAGAHFDGRLSNLDGLVSSWAYKKAYLETDRVGAFLDDGRVASIVQHFSAADLGRPGWFVGVDLSAWRVARVECVTLRLATRPWRRTHRFVAVLSRHEAARGPRFDEAARAWAALDACPPP